MNDFNIKLAYCILCHKYTPVLEALITWLGEGNDFYIHVDGKVDIQTGRPARICHAHWMNLISAAFKRQRLAITGRLIFFLPVK